MKVQMSLRLVFLFCFVGFTTLAFSCSDDVDLGDDAGTNENGSLDGGGQDDPDSGVEDELWFEPDPEGRVTEGDLLGENPEMVVVTSSHLAPAWEKYAALRSVQGVFTKVIRLDEVLEGWPGVDDAERLQSYLREQVQEFGLRFALLGGDAEVVPFRRIHAEVTVTTQETYTTNGPSLLYFANLEAPWDGDGDGNFGERGDDMTLLDARESQLAPGRVPVSHEEEVAAYTAKVEEFVGDVYGRSIHPLLVSDIAASIPIIGDVDAAEAIEVTFDEFFPQNHQSNVRKLYATEGAVSDFGGEVFTRELFDEALVEGYSVIFHQGHGGHGWLTDRVPTSFVEDMTNLQSSFLLSCACLAGNFADVAKTMTHDGWYPQGVDEDSAGEIYIVGEHGGVAYVGNTGTGLGPVGGSQFLHALFEGVFVHAIETIGEAFNYARGRAREIDFQVSLLPDMMDDDTEWWTQLVVTLLGDPSLSFHVQQPEHLSLDAPLEYGPGYQELVVDVSSGENQPVEGVGVSLWKSGDFYLSAETDSSGQAVFAFIPYGPGTVHVGAHGYGYAPVVARIEPITQ